MNKNGQILFLSLILLLAALWGAKSHAQSRTQSLQELQIWRQELSTREDLEDREKDLRLEFTDRLIFQVERKQGDRDLRPALQSILFDMKETDESKINQSFGSMGPFLEQLFLSYQNLLEPNESPLAFLQSFVEYSGVSEPAKMDDFASTRNYYDGRTLLPAAPKNLEEAAVILEQKEAERDKPSPYRLLTLDPASPTFYPGLEF